IDLDSPITLENGEKFSVVVGSNNTKLYIDTYNTSAGQSFVYFAEGATSYSSFNDTYNYSGNNFNVCLKALTTSSEVEKPDAPTNLSAVPGDGKALLFWEEVDDAEQYTVYYYNTQNDTGYVAIGSVTEPFRMMNTLTNGHAYRFAVTSTVNKVESELSSPIYVTPEAGASIIKIPTGLEAAADSGQVALSWDNMNGAKSYNVYCSTINNKYVNDAICKNVTANSCTITGLTNGTTYYFWVEACYVNGETSLGCDSVSATPKAAEAIVITNQPSSMTIMGGTKFTMSVRAEGTGLAFLWEYNDGNGWKALPSGSNFYYTGGTSAATAAIYNTAEFKDCSFRCVISDSDGNSTVTDSAVLSFYNESNITIGMVESLSTTNLVNYVNYFTTLYSDTFELTAAQLRAIELVLAEDYQ
ncbi:MAG: fibronectin type III domain-containing protein, partial [Oscillospiraceae bacterium]